MADHEQLNHEGAEIIRHTGPVHHGATFPLQGQLRIQPYDYRLAFTVDDKPDGFHPDIEDASLGYGLYTTPDPTRAAQYAYYHTDNFANGSPGMVSLYLNDYPLLNWVDSMHPSRNRTVPLKFLEAWFGYFMHNQHQIRGNGEAEETQKWWIRNKVIDYWIHLGQLADRLKETMPDHPGAQVDIHDLLGTGRGQPAAGFGASPIWGGLWARFLEERYGAKGMIVAQGVEDPSWGIQPTTTVVLYDLDEQLLAAQQAQSV